MIPLSFLRLSINELLVHSFFEEIDGIICNIDGQLGVEYNTVGVAFNFTLANQTVSSIYLYSDSDGSYSKYKGDIPHNITFHFSQIDINEKLGAPSNFGGNINDPILGYINPFDVYYFDDYVMNISYAKDFKSITSITLTTPEATIDPEV